MIAAVVRRRREGAPKRRRDPQMVAGKVDEDRLAITRMGAIVVQGCFEIHDMITNGTPYSFATGRFRYG